MPELLHMALGFSRKKPQKSNKFDHWNRAASLENLLQKRPSLAATMLDSWSTHPQDTGVRNSSFISNKTTPMQSAVSTSSLNTTRIGHDEVGEHNNGHDSASTPTKTTKRQQTRRRLSRSICSTNLLRSKSETAVNKVTIVSNTLGASAPEASRTHDLPGRSKSQILFQMRRVSSKPQDYPEEQFYLSSAKSRKASRAWGGLTFTAKIKARLILNLRYDGGAKSKRYSSTYSLAENKRIRRAQSVITLQSMGVTNDTIQLERLLHSKDFVRGFRKFLRREYSEENLDFWLRCEEFKKEKSKKRFKKAGEIYDKYLRPGSFNEVNVCAETRMAVEKQLVRPNADIFVKAQTQIYHLMLTDSFPRFMEIKWSQKNVSL